MRVFWGVFVLVLMCIVLFIRVSGKQQTKPHIPKCHRLPWQQRNPVREANTLHVCCERCKYMAAIFVMCRCLN